MRVSCPARITPYLSLSASVPPCTVHASLGLILNPQHRRSIHWLAALGRRLVHPLVSPSVCRWSMQPFGPYTVLSSRSLISHLHRARTSSASNSCPCSILQPPRSRHSASLSRSTRSPATHHFAPSVCPFSLLIVRHVPPCGATRPPSIHTTHNTHHLPSWPPTR